MYWRDEMSGKMLEAVVAFWSPYSDTPNKIPELSDQHVSFLRQYLIHWAEAPCWANNPNATNEHKILLNTAIAACKSIESRADINNAIDALMELGIDPF